MTDFNHASEVLERFGNQFGGLLDAAAALKELGGMDAHAKSLGAQVENLKSQAHEAQAELDRLNAATAQAVQDHNEQRKAQESKLMEDRKAAEDHAASIVGEAHDSAAKIVDEAKAQAEITISAAGATVVSLQAKADDIASTMKRAADARDAALAELADLNNRIAAARDAARQIMGGN